MEKLFHLKQNGTTVRTEVIAGLTTFLTMAYIIFLNPDFVGTLNLGTVDDPVPFFIMPSSAVITGTCLSAAVGTWLVGILSNYPLAQAPGLGLNAVFGYTLCLSFKLPAEAALAAVFIGGIFFILLTVTGARTALVNAIPASLKKAISAGIGLFIALIGFSESGIVVQGNGTTVDLAAFSSPRVILSLAGLVIITVLVIQNVRGAIFIGMLLTAVVGNICQFAFGLDMGILIPDSWVPALDFSMFGKCFWGFDELFMAPLASVFAVMITLIMVDMFDTVGTLIGAADKAGFLDENGNLPKMERAMMADALATTTGAVFGTSTVTTYVESTSGIAVGGRTGLTSMVTGLCFFLSMFISPIVGFVPRCATTPVLIIVGILMCSSLKDIDWGDLEVAFPCFFTVVGMPFFYSITDGMAFGFLSYLIVKLARGKFKEINPLVYVICGLFIVMYVIYGLQDMGVLQS